MGIPIWVYLIVTGIVISALMAIKTGKEERIKELDTIEREGRVFIERIEKEKEERRESKSHGS